MKAEKLLSRLEYHPDGYLIWKDGKRAGQKAGGINPNKGYWHIYNHRAHRLIFLLHHGYLPEQIDHINRDKLDNRIENLRAATHSQNQMNKPGTAKSGIKNVYWSKTNKAWRVIVKLNGKQHLGGYYKDISEAEVKARELRELLHGEFGRFI